MKCWYVCFSFPYIVSLIALGRSSSADAAVVGGSLQETAAEISSRGGKGIAVVCDHADDGQVKGVFDTIKRDAGRLDVLVNNAYSAVSVREI